MQTSVIVCAVVYATIALSETYTLNGISEILENENNIQNEEKQMRIGNRITLTRKECKVNKYFLKLKFAEYDAGLKNPRQFYASQHFFQVKNNITNSEVFKFLKKMPKGGVLHVHDSAASSHEFLFSLTYEPNLWVCLANWTVRFQFARSIPKTTFQNLNCTWQLLSELRANSDNVKKLDERIRGYMTLETRGNPLEIYPTSAEAWTKLDDAFIVLDGIVSYRPAFEKIWHNFLRELYLDNVQYVEVRSSIRTLYELNETRLSDAEVVEIIRNVVNNFKITYKDFFDVKVIYSKSKSQPSIQKYIENYKKLKKVYPNFIIGFDLVGHEDSHYPLKQYLEELKQMPSDTQYFFHAGETNWFGVDVDWNLLSAILLGTKRIGHGYAILKHPKILEFVRQNNIGIEVSPISNQVLRYVTDLRNHPATILMAEDDLVVISNDDPALWGVQGVNYDFYEATMAFLSRDNDLKALKQLAKNSISTSGLTDSEKSKLEELFSKHWNKFIDEIYRNLTPS